MTYVGSSVVYVGSHLGNSQIIRIHPSAVGDAQNTSKLVLATLELSFEAALVRVRVNCIDLGRIAGDPVGGKVAVASVDCVQESIQEASLSGLA